MHLHSQEEICMKTMLCFPQPCEKSANLVKEASELLPKTVEEMVKHNIVLGILTEVNLDEVYRWMAVNFT